MTVRQLDGDLGALSRMLDRVAVSRPRVVFEPSPGLEDFMEDDSRRICVLAANRVGKTLHAVQKLARAMRARPNTRWRIVGPTTKRVNRVHGRYLFEALKDVLVEGSVWNPGTGFNAANLAKIRNGSTCELLSYEQDPSSHASDSLHGVLLDEPPPPGHFEEAEGRVFDTQGVVWVTLTAVGRPVKWFRLVVEAGARDRERGLADGWSFYQVALSKENCPWYTRAQIAERVREVQRTPWTFAQRILGAWEGVSDERYFTAYSGDTNLLPLTVGHRGGWPSREPVSLALSVDHGEGAGHSHWVLLGYQVLERTPWGTKVYVRAMGEWTNDRRMTVASEVAGVREMVEGTGASLRWVKWAVGDHNVASKSESARSMNELFEAEFARVLGAPLNSPPIVFRRAKKGAGSIEAGVGTVNRLFDEVVEGGSGSANALQIDERCERVVQACAHWAGKDDDLKHAADALRYGVVAVLDEVGHPAATIVAG